MQEIKSKEQIEENVIMLNILKEKALRDKIILDLDNYIQEYGFSNGHIIEIAICGVLSVLHDYYGDKFIIETSYENDLDGIDLKINNKELQIKSKFDINKPTRKARSDKNNCLLLFDSTGCININKVLINLNIELDIPYEEKEQEIEDIWNYYRKFMKYKYFI